MRYRVFFQYGDTDISEEDFKRLAPLPQLQINSQYGGHSPLFFITSENKLICLDKITHVIPIQEEGQSTVITPPSPQQLKNEHEQEEANRPVTLDDQLASDEVGA